MIILMLFYILIDSSICGIELEMFPDPTAVTLPVLGMNTALWIHPSRFPWKFIQILHCMHQKKDGRNKTKRQQQHPMARSGLEPVPAWLKFYPRVPYRTGPHRTVWTFRHRAGACAWIGEKERNRRFNFPPLPLRCKPCNDGFITRAARLGEACWI
ncbi:hypothetical protein B0H19DRAFT_1170581 [Mycena capillaripes]|nr:hypothetical protein B0H19DRAFT_1170581 [Mycena capillaripes]